MFPVSCQGINANHSNLLTNDFLAAPFDLETSTGGTQVGRRYRSRLFDVAPCRIAVGALDHVVDGLCLENVYLD